MNPVQRAKSVLANTERFLRSPKRFVLRQLHEDIGRVAPYYATHEPKTVHYLTLREVENLKRSGLGLENKDVPLGAIRNIYGKEMPTDVYSKEAGKYVSTGNWKGDRVQTINRWRDFEQRTHPTWRNQLKVYIEDTKTNRIPGASKQKYADWVKQHGGPVPTGEWRRIENSISHEEFASQKRMVELRQSYKRLWMERHPGEQPPYKMERAIYGAAKKLRRQELLMNRFRGMGQMRAKNDFTTLNNGRRTIKPMARARYLLDPSIGIGTAIAAPAGIGYAIENHTEKLYKRAYNLLSPRMPNEYYGYDPYMSRQQNYGYGGYNQFGNYETPSVEHTSRGLRNAAIGALVGLAAVGGIYGLSRALRRAGITVSQFESTAGAIKAAEKVIAEEPAKGKIILEEAEKEVASPTPQITSSMFEADKAAEKEIPSPKVNTPRPAPGSGKGTVNTKAEKAKTLTSSKSAGLLMPKPINLTADQRYLWEYVEKGAIPGLTKKGILELTEVQAAEMVASHQTLIGKDLEIQRLIAEREAREASRPGGKK
jgi:hypothetical protein